MMEVMKAPVIAPELQEARSTENPGERYNAVLFRGRIYVSYPRHMDAINLAFKGMTEKQRHRVWLRIADAKEQLLFGTALGDGSEWEWDEKWQAARMKMYV